MPACQWALYTFSHRACAHALSPGSLCLRTCVRAPNVSLAHTNTHTQTVVVAAHSILILHLRCVNALSVSFGVCVRVPPAFVDCRLKGPEIISLNMTGVMIVYSSLFAKWAWVVNPRNMALCACHVSNVFAQGNQLRRAVEHKLSLGQAKEMQDMGYQAAAGVAGLGALIVGGPTLQTAIVGANLGPVRCEPTCTIARVSYRMRPGDAYVPCWTRCTPADGALDTLSHAHAGARERVLSSRRARGGGAL